MGLEEGGVSLEGARVGGDRVGAAAHRSKRSAEKVEDGGVALPMFEKILEVTLPLGGSRAGG
jgi:hypothetical protein